jgi:hypothetical protein
MVKRFGGKAPALKSELDGSSGSTAITLSSRERAPRFHGMGD